eukprot:12126482-Heterocapsa_arctica.AAC.1
MIGVVKKCEVPPINQYTLGARPKLRPNTCDLEYQKWDMINDDVILDSFKSGLLVTGMAGNGKTFTLNNITNSLDETDEYITIAPTHKA